MRKVVLAALLAFPAAFSAAGEGAGSSGDAIPNQFLIRLADGGDPEGTARALADAHGLALLRVYRRAAPGFAALVPPFRLDVLRRDPRVRALGQDRVLLAGPLAGAQLPVSARQIALFDTGISSGPAAPAVLLSPGVTFVVGEASPALEGLDDHGHGTAVARELSRSRPDAALLSVKVLGTTGGGSFSDLIAGLDWLLDGAAHPRLDAAVFSLGAACPVCRPDSLDEGVAILHEAVKAVHDSGVTLSATADAAGSPDGLPGSFPEVSVTAQVLGAPAAVADTTFRLGEAYAYPNPARGGERPVIHIETGLADRVTVRLFDVSGRQVAVLAKEGLPSLIDDGQGPQYAYELAWEGSIASGVYFFVARAEKAGASPLSVTGKLAVVR